MPRARAARTYHWSRENEMMKRMPAGRRAIYAWTTALWPRNQVLHTEAGDPGSRSHSCPCTGTSWEGSGGVLLGLLLSAEAWVSTMRKRGGKVRGADNGAVESWQEKSPERLLASPDQLWPSWVTGMPTRATRWQYSVCLGRRRSLFRDH